MSHNRSLVRYCNLVKKCVNFFNHLRFVGFVVLLEIIFVPLLSLCFLLLFVMLFIWFYLYSLSVCGFHVQSGSFAFSVYECDALYFMLSVFNYHAICSLLL